MISQRSATCLLYTTTTVYVLFLLTLTHLPLDNVINDTVQHQTRQLWADKLIHGALYSFLTLLSMLCSQPVKHDDETGELLILPDRLIAMAIILMLVGTLDEITQPWFGRSMELLDLAADFSAIFPGFCLFLLSHIIRQSFGHAKV